MVFLILGVPAKACLTDILSQSSSQHTARGQNDRTHAFATAASMEPSDPKPPRRRPRPWPRDGDSQGLAATACFALLVVATAATSSNDEAPIRPSLLRARQGQSLCSPSFPTHNRASVLLTRILTLYLISLSREKNSRLLPCPPFFPPSPLAEQRLPALVSALLRVPHDRQQKHLQQRPQHNEDDDKEGGLVPFSVVCFRKGRGRDCQNASRQHRHQKEAAAAAAAAAAEEEGRERQGVVRIPFPLLPQ